MAALAVHGQLNGVRLVSAGRLTRQELGRPESCPHTPAILGSYFQSGSVVTGDTGYILMRCIVTRGGVSGCEGLGMTG